MTDKTKTKITFEELVKQASDDFCEAYVPAMSIGDADDLKMTADIAEFFDERNYNFDLVIISSILNEYGFKKYNLGIQWVWMLKRR
jgi:hypothetical protein